MCVMCVCVCVCVRERDAVCFCACMCLVQISSQGVSKNNPVHNFKHHTSLPTETERLEFYYRKSLSKI